jgi:hypothetical protein
VPDDDLSSPPGLLKQAIKAVPAVKHALGIGGVIAVIAPFDPLRLARRRKLYSSSINHPRYIISVNCKIAISLIEGF